MPSVVVSPAAKRNLSRIITTHNLPRDTRARVRNRIQPLADFPLMGAELARRWGGFRFILGPWAWMLIVYSYDREEDQVNVLTIEDVRMADSATSQERSP